MSATAQPVFRAGHGRSRLRHPLAVFGVVIVVAIGVGLVFAESIAPDEGLAACPVVQKCPPSPAQPGDLVRWESTELKFRLAYPSNLFEVAEENGRSLKLGLKDSADRGDLSVWIEGAPSTDASPQDLLDRRLDDLRDDIIGLDLDEPLSTGTSAPRIGSEPATTGGAYQGVINTPQGPGDRVFVTVLAAGSAGLSAVVSAATTNEPADSDTSGGSCDRNCAMSLADTVFKSFEWPSNVAATVHPASIRLTSVSRW